MGSTGLGTTGDTLPGGANGPPAVGSVSRGPGVWGLILQELSPAGSKVKKGNVVASFDRENMLNRLDDYQAVVLQAQADIKKLKAQLLVSQEAYKHLIEVGKSNLDKAKLDYKTAVVRSAIDGEKLKLAVDEAQADYKQTVNAAKQVDTSLKAQLRVAEIDFIQANSELKRATGNLDRMVVKAPMNGTVVLYTTWRGGQFGQIKQGDILRPGQTFVKVVDTDSMVIDAKINQVDVEKIRIGQKASIRFDAFPDLVLPAHVYSVGVIAQAPGFMASYVKEVPVSLRLDAMDPRVIPDLSVSVDVTISSEANAIVAPRAAIFSDAGTKQAFAFVRSTSGWEKRTLDPGLSTNVAVAIRSGLRPGEVVATGWPPAIGQSKRQ